MNRKVKISRRDWLQFASATSLLGLGAPIWSCGPNRRSKSYAVKANSTLVAEKTVYGLRVRTTGGIPAGVIKAQQIVDGTSVTLAADEGSHRHPFTLSSEQMLKLRAGEQVSLVTERASGHTHNVVIDPSDRRSQITSDAAEFSEETGDLYAALSAEEQPYLYVEGSEDLGADDVAYCADSPEKCAEESDLWVDLKQVDGLSNRQVFRTPKALSLNESEDNLISLRGKSKESGSFIRRVLKIVAK